MLSVTLAVYNEEKNLEACLASVRDIAGEIVVVDGGSTDRTIEIAKQFHAKVIQANNPKIFHINKQKALEACRGEWILQLDADEVIPNDLQQEIVTAIQSDFNGYYIPRKNYFWGHFMKKGGQYPDYVIRLVRNGKAHFPCKSVHEQIEVSGKVGYLKHPMLHYTNRTRAEYWKKADTYTSLTAKNLTIPKTFRSYLLYTFWKPLMTFFTIYIRHKGFVDGLQGFEFALYSGIHWAMAYRKYVLLLIVYCLFVITPFVYADYVLPYPSIMPGNKIYRISRVVDRLKEYWYFGNIAKVKYHLGLADKYLVEAKTLFEYKQYLLAIDALKRSNDHFALLPQFLKYDIQKNMVCEAGDMHILVLEGLATKLPEEFLWQPEKADSTVLPIGSLIREAKGLRRAVKDICLP